MHCTSCENMVTANKMEVASFTNVKYTHTHTHTPLSLYFFMVRGIKSPQNQNSSETTVFNKSMPR